MVNKYDLGELICRLGGAALGIGACTFALLAKVLETKKEPALLEEAVEEESKDSEETTESN